MTARLKQQRDNWKRRALAAERETAERIAQYCWERRGHFVTDAAAESFAQLIRGGYYKTTPPTRTP